MLEARFTSSGACSFRVWPPCWKRALRHPGITILITSIIIINTIITISTTILIDFVHCSPVLIAFRGLFAPFFALLAPPGPLWGALRVPRGPLGPPLAFPGGPVGLLGDPWGPPWPSLGGPWGSQGSLEGPRGHFGGLWGLLLGGLGLP